MTNLKVKRDLDNPAVYCGTYAKYNNGSLFGEWVDLTQFTDTSDFYAFCAELHKDEEDPEFMFQDYENFPASLYCESAVTDGLYDWINMDSDDQELLAAAIDCFGDITLEQAQGAYYGQYDSDEDFAQSLAEETGAINDDLQWPYTCIDWEYAAREIMYHFVRSDSGHVFNRNW